MKEGFQNWRDNIYVASLGHDELYKVWIFIEYY